MPVDQPQPIRVVCVPNAEQLARPRFFRDQFHPFGGFHSEARVRAR